MSKIKVRNIDITIIKNNDEDYISLTDMIKAKDGSFFISDWLRNRNTLEFLSVWEQLNNPNFNDGEFEVIRNQAGLNSFKISVKEWFQKTQAIGLIAKAGRYGGTYAHKDIAFEFGTWISPAFKLFLIREFQGLKDREAKKTNTEWSFRRFLSKVNYKLQTDAIKDVLIPISNINKDEEGIIYANEAELLNIAMFGITSKDGKKYNPDKVLSGLNIRDVADVVQLTVLSNLESHNADMIRQNISPKQRLIKLRELAITQLRSLRSIHFPFSVESPHSAGIIGATQSDFGIRSPSHDPPPERNSDI